MEKLINYNFKITKQRKKILSLFEESKIITISEIQSILKDDNFKISLETLYKNIYLFEKVQLIDKVIFDHKIHYYLKTEQCSHKAICIKCRNIFNFGCPTFEESEFNIVNHYLSLEIICDDCLKST